MVNVKELKSRVQDRLRFSQQEISGLIAAVVITAFIFSFRDWGPGDTFSLTIGLGNLVLMFLVASLSFVFRLSCQKIYALSQGYKAEFKVWWVGLIIAVLIAFISVGHVPLVLIGGVVSSFMVRHRLGEFRYGASHAEMGMVALWGIWGNMILAMIFSLGLLFFPQSYFLNKALLFNLIMAGTSLLPLPQLDGLKIFFGSRFYYIVGVAAVAIGSVLLLTKTTLGLIITIVVGVVAGAIYILVGSEK